jgi:hypothetical protein
MPISINGSGTVTGITAGGLPDGVITTDDIAAGAVTTPKITGGPAFRAVNTSSQSVSSGTYTKIVFQAETYDTANCFDSATTYRFTPNVAGYYFVTAYFACTLGAYANAFANCSIYKNGAAYREASSQPTNGNYSGVAVSTTIYMNGTTDYLEIYTVSNQSLTVIGNGTGSQYTACFEAFLARPA